MAVQRRRVLLLGAALALPWPFAAQARDLPPEVAAALPAARLVGSGRLRVWGFQVYDARLWSPADVSSANWAQQPLALELQYLRKFKGPDIAERSLEEMRRQGDIAPATAARWLAEMKQVFPDVAEGDRITGVQQPGQATRFFVDGKFKGEVPGDDFAQRFFGIWLAPQTSEPAMRGDLLGGTR